MKIKSTLFALVLASVTSFAHLSAKALTSPDTNGLRSDTIDVLHYNINLNITDYVKDTIRGYTVVQFTPKMNGIKTLCLDLLSMKVDSIVMNSTQLTYTYANALITMNLPATMNIGDTGNAYVYYHGKPVIDATGWGGFYFNNPYAFNLGVGFAAIPHNYGRTWFPCFDNFVSRSTYRFNITSDSAYPSFCNGYITKDSVSGGKRMRTWILDKKIPTYLACVDISNYVQLNDTFRGADTIPIVIATPASDSTNVKNSFIHLKNAIGIYQNCFGPYRWNKVGYSMVSFSSGAMEHPTNIAYPVLAANGSLTYEADIMAHELSHHWFGDLVTCQNAEQMWLNEGFATYCQFVFSEYMYNETAYHAAFRSNHETSLHYDYVTDHGYWAVANVPQWYTYGNTSYLKGADVLGTLRAYVGDSNFYNGLKYYLNGHMFQTVNSDTLKASMERYSGMNLTNFFNNWVKAPGYPHFSIDSMAVSGNGPYTVKLYVRQRLTGAPAYYTGVPMQVTFKAANWATNKQNITVSGHLSNYTLTVPFKPVFAALNMDEKIMDAKAPDTAIAKAVATYNGSNARFLLTVTSITDSAFLYYEHNYTAPDPVKDTSLHYRISPNRYWKFSGVFPANFKATAKLYYDGRKITTNGNGYLDTALTVATSDSLILLYRPNTATDWTEFLYYTKHVLGPATNRYGYMQLDSVFPGEYAFANGKSHVLQGIQSYDGGKTGMKLYPNPTSDNFTIELATSQSKQMLDVYDMQGKLVKELIINPGQKLYTISTSGWSNASYMVTLISGNKKVASKELVVNH